MDLFIANSQYLTVSRIASVDVEEVWRVLSRVEVPGFDVDVVSSGLVKKIRISRDGAGIAVYLDFLGSDPGCGFCKFINHTLIATVAGRIKEALKSLGFTDVFVVDAVTGAEI